MRGRKHTPRTRVSMASGLRACLRGMVREEQELHTRRPQLRQWCFRDVKTPKPKSFPQIRHLSEASSSIHFADCSARSLRTATYSGMGARPWANRCRCSERVVPRGVVSPRRCCDSRPPQRSMEVMARPYAAAPQLDESQNWLNHKTVILQGARRTSPAFAQWRSGEPRGTVRSWELRAMTRRRNPGGY